MTNNPKARWAKHKSVTSVGAGASNFYYIHASMKKYGLENFKFEIIQEHIEDELIAASLEKYWIKLYNSNNSKYGMNLTEGGEGTYGIRRFGKDNYFYGKTHSEETKKKISNANKGKYRVTFAGKQNTIKSISGENNKHAKLTDNKVKEIINKYISGNYTYQQLADEYRVTKPAIVVIFNFKGWTHVTADLSNDTKLKIQEVKNKNIHDGEKKSGKNGSFYGKTHTKEAKDKISKAHIGKDFKTPKGKERHRKAISGANNASAKLTVEDVKLIRKNCVENIWNYKDVMNEYGVKQATVHRILANKTYINSDYSPAKQNKRQSIFHIYKLVNKANNKVFINSVGQNPDKFWTRFKTKKACTLLNNAIKEHGKDNFLFEAIETIYSKDKLNDRVNYWINHYKSNQEEFGYNLKAKTGPSEEGKKKISKANTGKTRSKWHKKQISKAQSGKAKSKEHKRKIGAAQTGEQNHMAKLSEQDVVNIRALYESGREIKADLARMYCVTPMAINRIIARKTWKHVA